ncbi:MAG TPA: spore germination protein GerW family protein [Dehalococcoidia bacterium]
MTWETEQQRTEAEQRALDELSKRIGTLSDVPERATVRTVFGEPIRIGERTIIPVAQVSYMVGFGMGRGTGPGAGGGPASSGGGGGGGTRVQAKPLALCEVSPDGVRMIPVMDQTRIAVWGIVSGMVMLWLITRLIRALLK